MVTHNWRSRSWTWLLRSLGFGSRVLRSFLRNRGILLAGGVGYNALLSIVPFVTLTFAALSVFLDEARIVGILGPKLAVVLPQHADSILESVEVFLRHQAGISAVSVVVLLFFASVAFRMLEEAVAAMFRTATEGPKRRFWISALLPFLFMLPLMIGLFFTTLLTSSLDAMGAQDVQILGQQLSVTYGVSLLLRAAGFVGLVILFAAIYLVLPPVKVPLRHAAVGGLCAAVLWRGVGMFLAYYFTSISMVNLIYGSLATVVVVLLSLEVVFIILLLGTQVIAELEASSTAGLPWHEDPRNEVDEERPRDRTEYGPAHAWRRLWPRVFSTRRR